MAWLQPSSPDITNQGFNVYVPGVGQGIPRRLSEPLQVGLFTCPLFTQERAAMWQSKACFPLQGKSENLAEAPKAGPGQPPLGSPLAALHGAQDSGPAGREGPELVVWGLCSLPASVQRSTTSEPSQGKGRRGGDPEASRASLAWPPGQRGEVTELGHSRATTCTENLRSARMDTRRTAATPREFVNTQGRDARSVPSTVTTYATRTECSRQHSVTHTPQARVTPTITDRGVRGTSVSAHSTDPLRDWYTAPRVCTQGREGMPRRA